MKGKVLVTGGAGYIGSHTVLPLINAGIPVVLFDNFSNSKRPVLDRLAVLAQQPFEWIEGDIRDAKALRKVFVSHEIESVMHFAGVKAVAEAQKNPLKYYDNNVLGSIVLLQEMAKANISRIVFSSSATVYGNPGYRKYSEDTPTQPLNVYGRTKKVVEDLLLDCHQSDPRWRVALLRYFNPVGAHASGLIGEDPLGTPDNLMPFIAQVAVGVREHLNVYGKDYSTPDGTGLRDYIHVEDLATGHLQALQALSHISSPLIVNLGTGQPFSVLEVLRAFEKASGRSIPYHVQPRREGDLDAYYADPSSAQTLLGWSAQRSLDHMCVDTWRWQSQNPQGY
ncbi:MAG: UDP-glucose 4-epimerase GalE [Holosporales bacterium]